ncbi:MAG: HIT family protein [Crocinitomicaceae bacterium]|nr:HIT family protein [Crocinitomicaceae bacterium]MDG1735256.1 HIT family protein [Crocinitomicaceae bacterium]MDG2504607.1 HIT family protein [Crocinitomicaceae bacterium]
MPSVFTKIINGDIPSYKIAENDSFYAFLDINPLVKGHTLVVPKVEIDYLFDLDDQTLQDMMLFAKSVAVKIKEVIPCKRIGVSVIGLEVPHAHIHLVPLTDMADINFSGPKLALSVEELKVVQDLIIKG